jgi:hypothetical protein
LSVWHGNQGMAAVRLKNKGMTITVVHASGDSLYYILKVMNGIIISLFGCYRTTTIHRLCCHSPDSSR